MGILRTPIKREDLVWIESRFEEFARFYKENTSTNAAEHAEIDAEIERMKLIMAGLKFSLELVSLK